MLDERILYPVFAMAGLTFTVWVRMFTSRLAEMKRERIHPQSVATSASAAARFVDTRAADNFRNLFELPVLFYVALLVAFGIGLVTPLSLGLAWAFVCLRLLHSLIQCTYNKVLHRFYVYVAGGAVLGALWLYLVLHQRW